MTMPASVSCPEPDCWQALLAASLSPEEAERCERHLAVCPACQERLDRAPACAEELRQLARQTGDPTTASADPTLIGLVERLHEVQSGPGLAAPENASPEPADLYFLRPTDRPDLLGMLGVYEVQEVIAQGGMGVVLKAYEPALQRLVAIKVLAAAIAGSAIARRRFTREAQAAAAVCHDHVVAVHGVHEIDGLPYLVMQYVDGESVQRRLNHTGPLAVDEIVRIGQQTASGLAAAHAQGLIHRDITPANLLLERVAGDGWRVAGEDKDSSSSPITHHPSPATRVKITDFGLARMIDDVGLTQNGVVAGTPEYMAPEQARGEALDHRSDLFSLGSVLYALCTGVPPFRGANTLAVLRQVSEETPPPIRSLNPEVPAWLEALVARLMAKDPAERFQSAAEVARLLEDYLAHLHQPDSIPVPPPVPAGPTSPRRARRLFFLGALLLAALGAAGALQVVAQLAPGVPVKPGAYPHEVYHDFRGGQGLPPPMKLIGPDAAAVTRAEAEGLRITLAADRQPAHQPRPAVGVAPGFPLRGDFEITGTYELLSADRAAAGAGVAVGLNLAVEQPYKFAKVGRFVRAKQGNVHLAEVFLKETPSGSKMDEEPTEARAGQVRAVRAGSTLRLLVAAPPGTDFREILRGEFGTEDVNVVRFIVNNNDSPVGVDARLVDLRIRWDGVARAGRGAAEAAPRWRRWLLLALLFALGLLAAAGVWLYRRHTSHQPAPAEGRDDSAI
jgi:serine/threonine protein kinase